MCSLMAFDAAPLAIQHMQGLILAKTCSIR
jgi:hypothetical protein